MKILIVEDNDDNAYILSRLLQSEITGVEVSVQRTLAGALGSIDNYAADITLLDLMLPDCTIDEVIDAIPRFHPPVIVFSGVNSSDTLVKCFAKGAKDFIRKGSIELLMNAITSAYLRDKAPKMLAEQEARDVK